MAKYFRYERGISDVVVRDITLHRFNEEVRIANAVIELNADDEMISEWIGVQNVELYELSEEDAMAWRMENPTAEVIEAMSYLASTDYKMTIDYAASMSEEERVIVETARAQAREVVRNYKIGRAM